MSSLACFNLALTEGPNKGWNTPIFIAPITLSIILGLAFFAWESFVRSDRAMLPPVIWKIPNAVIATLAIMVAFPFWATSQLQYATYYQEVGKWPATRVAVSMLPQGIVAVTLGFALRFIPFVVERPRLTIGSGSLRVSCCETKVEADNQSSLAHTSSSSSQMVASASITGNSACPPSALVQLEP